MGSHFAPTRPARPRFLDLYGLRHRTGQGGHLEEMVALTWLSRHTEPASMALTGRGFFVKFVGPGKSFWRASRRKRDVEAHQTSRATASNLPAQPGTQRWDPRPRARWS